MQNTAVILLKRGGDCDPGNDWSIVTHRNLDILYGRMLSLGGVREPPKDCPEYPGLYVTEIPLRTNVRGRVLIIEINVAIGVSKPIECVTPPSAVAVVTGLTRKGVQNELLGCLT
jgi:hypothetical protein